VRRLELKEEAKMAAETAKSTSTSTPKKNIGPLLRAAAIIVLSSCTLAAAYFGLERVEQFLIRDPRFALPAPPDYGEASPNLIIEGTRFASLAQIRNVFSADYGRSIYLLPLAGRRNALLRLSWVREATVQRVWPDRVVVHIVERRPAAFVEIPAGPLSRFALIDADGVILDTPPKARFDLPVLRGLNPAESQAMRGTRVRRMIHLLRDLGSLGNGISEVDVSDLDNLKVRMKVRDQTFLLILGDADFAARVRNFLDHYAEIRARIPWATTLDLRLEDRITAVGDAPDGR
jgi:cell division protein FtsQ